MNKETKKILRRKAAWFFLKGIVSLTQSLSLGAIYFIGKIFGSFAYVILFFHRKVALEGLAIAFPNLSLKERKKIARDFFIFMAQGSLEVFYFLKNPKALEDVRIEGKENLDKALNKGKGVIAVTAHLGNFPLMNLKLATIGLPINVMARPMRDPKAGDYLQTLRTQSGVKTILSYPRRECISGVMKALRNNEIIIIHMDQNFGTGGVWVKFFGKLAATPVGPIVFALRAQAAVVPIYIVREGQGKHCIKIMPELPLTITADSDETVLLNAITITRIFESWIKDVPSLWGWIHRRWKSRPSEQIENLKFKIEK